MIAFCNTRKGFVERRILRGLEPIHLNTFQLMQSYQRTRRSYTITSCHSYTITSCRPTILMNCYFMTKLPPGGFPDKKNARDRICASMQVIAYAVPKHTLGLSDIMHRFRLSRVYTEIYQPRQHLFIYIVFAK